MNWDDIKAGAKDRDIAVAEKAARGRARRLGLLSGLNGEAKAAKFINCDSEIETTKRARGKITRVPFAVSRLMEFCNRRELVNQTGHNDSDWPLVILKELVDNSLDDCEEAEIAPAVWIAVKRGSIVIQDNGRGIPVETIRGILDYGIRVSSREAYVSPTRGAQGNALKTILPMGYVLDERRGEKAAGHTIIEAHGVAHHIRFTVDHIRQEPKIEHNTKPSSINHGTRITVRLPTKIKIYEGCECDYLEERKSEFLRLAEAFAWLNPHLSLRVSWNGEKKIDIKASNPAWSKWLPSWPTSSHWYDAGRFKRYMAAHIAHRGGITVRKFISEFDGLSAIAKQKQILAETGVSHVKLYDFFGRDKVNNRKMSAPV